MQTHARAFSQSDICAGYVQIAAIQVETLRRLMAAAHAHGETLRVQLAAAEAVLRDRQTRFSLCAACSCPCGLYADLPVPPTQEDRPGREQQRPAA